MGQSMVNDLLDQYQRSFRMLVEEISRFNQHQWKTGLSNFYTPAYLAIHIVECLDYYFSGKSGDQYIWGYRFHDQLPEQTPLLDYFDEIKERVIAELSALQDSDLSRPFTIDDSGSTWLGHYIYALRHTIHHQGELAVLAVQQGLEGGSWS